MRDSPLAEVAKTGHGSSPYVLLFTSAHPDGRLVPLRQPQPPVYFQNEAPTSDSAQPQDDVTVQLHHDYPDLRQWDCSGDAMGTQQRSQFGDGLRHEYDHSE
jgi:hypothetical protein